MIVSVSAAMSDKNWSIQGIEWVAGIRLKLRNESNDVDPEIVKDWQDKMKKMCESYESRKVFNLDEIGLFFRVLPNKALALEGKKCSSGRKLKELC